MQKKKALRYDSGKTDWTLLDFSSIEPAVRVMRYGAQKYDRENWKLPVDDPRQHLRCAMRHLIAMIQGQEIDVESGERHSGHVICNMMMYNYHTPEYNVPQTTPLLQDDADINMRTPANTEREPAQGYEDLTW